MRRPGRYTAGPGQATRRGAMMLLAGALTACGGGGTGQEPAQEASAPGPAAPTPSPGVPQTGMLNRNGLHLTFSDDFSALSQDHTIKLPLNGKWQTWLNNGGKDNFHARTLHASNGVEQQYYLDSYILKKHCAHIPGFAQYDPFSLVDGPNGKVLRITARAMEPAMQAALRDKLGIAQGQSSYAATKYWSSGCITTFEGFNQKYGVFEARVKMSRFAGSWPAFWMLNAAGGWPPEIDIFDNYPQKGAMNRIVLGGVIREGSGWGPRDGGQDGKAMPYDVRGAWHTIGAEWDARNITYYANDVQIFQAPTPSNFHVNMFPILNLAIVGQDNTWADRPTLGTQTIELDIDWVKVWKRA